MNAETWIPALLIFGATGCATLALVLLWALVRDSMSRKKLRRRLAEALGDPSLAREWRVGDAGGLVTGVQGRSPGSIATRVADRVPMLRDLPTMLERADVEWNPSTFLLVSTGCGLACGSVVLMLARGPLLPAIAFWAGLVLPYFFLRLRVRRNLREFEEQLPDAIDLLTRSIRAGHPLTGGMRMVGEEGPTRVSKEFRKTMEEHRFGLPFEDALLGMVDRVDLVDVRIFATAVLVQRESGGNLAEILDNLGQTIRDRFTIRRQLRVYTAQGRLSGYVLGSLPVVVGSFFYFIEPEYVEMLWVETLGRILLVTAVVLQILGVLWIRKIIDIEI